MTCGRDWQDERATSRLKEWIQRSLGCGVVSVELTDEQLSDAIDEAKNYWQMWVGNIKTVLITVTTSREYPAISISDDVDSVVDVIFDTTSDGMRNLWGWAGVDIDPMQYISGYGMGGIAGYNTGSSSLAQYMMRLEDAQRLTSGDRDWRWDKARRTLIISPPNANIAKMMVYYLSKCFDYLALSSYEWTLFREYCLGKAMMKLAVIRTQFQSLPSATGDFSLDGDSLWANAEAKLMQLEDKMRLMQRPCDIMTG